jgi:hypothetical protein
MKTNDLEELAAWITAAMRVMAERAFLEIVPPTVDLLDRGKEASPQEIAAADKSPEEVCAGRLALPRTLGAAGEHRVPVPGHRRAGARGQSAGCEPTVRSN